jgi:hypothetical protein
MDLSPLYSRTDVKLSGLSEAQEEACHAALQEFRDRHGLSYWGLNVNLTEDGPQTWQVDISVVASPDLNFQVRSNRLTVDKTLDLARVVDLCLETHFHACMNTMSVTRGWVPSAKPPRSEGLTDRPAARAKSAG